MSWLYSQALVEEYLEGTSWGGAQYALWRLIHMPQAYCAPDKMTAFSRPSRFGMTFGPLMENRSAELLTWYLVGFPVRTSAPLGKAQESRENVADCGAKWHALSAKYDHDSRSWKTHRSLFDGDLIECSAILPAWGLMQDGELWERTTAALPTSENESGFWPTPNTVGYRSDGELLMLGRLLNDESEYLAMTSRASNNKRKSFAPTPRANDAEKRGNFDDTNPRNGLAGFAKRYPTPRASDPNKGGPNSRDGSGSLHLSSAAYLADANGEGLAQRQSKSSDDGEECQTDIGVRGWPAEPAVGRVVNGVAARVDRLKALGNGQVPIVAATAWRVLLGDRDGTQTQT